MKSHGCRHTIELLNAAIHPCSPMLGHQVASRRKAAASQPAGCRLHLLWRALHKQGAAAADRRRLAMLRRGDRNLRQGQQACREAKGKGETASGR